LKKIIMPLDWATNDGLDGSVDIHGEFCISSYKVPYWE
jgi:hypothetical protein